MKTVPPATSPELPPSAGPATSPQLPPLVTRRKRNGKIARLPAQLREALNLMLYDGNSYPSIIKEHKGLTLAEILDTPVPTSAPDDASR